jgi:hypothetical protein
MYIHDAWLQGFILACQEKRAALPHPDEDLNPGLFDMITKDLPNEVQAFMYRRPDKRLALLMHAHGQVLAHKILPWAQEPAEEASLPKAAEEKTAVPRWEALERAGLLGGEDLARLVNAAHPAAGEAAAIRQGLQAAATDLSPAQLARHRVLRGLQASNIARLEGVKPQNIPGMGAATTAHSVHVAPHTGTSMRFASKFPTSKLEGVAGMAGNMMPTLPPWLTNFLQHPEDPVLQHSILNHELGEKALFNASQAKNYTPRPIASHFGAAPDVIERMSTFRDPAANAAMDRLRQLHPEDAWLSKKMRQFGATPGAPMPVGGRAHRALEHQTMTQAPLSGQTIGRRFQTEAPLPPAAQEAVRTGAATANKWADRIKPFLPSNMRKNVGDLQGHVNQYLEPALARPTPVEDPHKLVAALTNFRPNS